MPNFSKRMLDRAMRLQAQLLAAERQREQEAIKIYRFAAQEIAERIEKLNPENILERDRLLQIRRRIIALMTEANERFAETIRKGWREAAEISLQRTIEMFQGMPEMKNVRFRIDPTQGQEYIRATVRHLSDPLVQGVRLSDRIFNVQSYVPSEAIRQIGIGVALGEGAPQIARRIKTFLTDTEGSARQAGTMEALRTKARRARDAGDTEAAARLFTSAREKAAQLPRVGRGVYRSPTANAQRIVRMELAKAERATIIEYTKSKKWTAGVRWELSAAHPKQDICDELVGVYPADSVPLIPHPHCLCLRFPVPNESITGEKIEYKTTPASLQAVLESIGERAA